jgi:hypothetical protein
VKIDLEKGLLEVVLLTLDNWSHLQLVDFDNFSFKCKTYHEYGHFAKKLQVKSTSTTTRARKGGTMENYKEKKERKTIHLARGV